MKHGDTKADKLKRILPLRIMHYLGMISWKTNEFGDDIQHLRLLHPFTWLWIALVCVVGVFFYGIPKTYTEIKDQIRNNTVWW